MKKIILSMSLMAALFFVSCDQNSANDEVQGSTSAYQTSVNSQAKLASSALTEEGVNCTPVSDNAVVNRALTASTGDYCAWTPAPKTIGLVGVQFEGVYGSGLRPTTSGWYVGVVAPSVECTINGWSAIAAAIDVKNDTSVSPSNVGSDPLCTSTIIIPENVVGANGSAFSSSFGLGYYDYLNRVITITKKIVIWKDNNSSLTWPTDYSNPTAATVTDAYLVEITSVVPTHTASAVFGTVNYTYTKIK